MIAVKQSRIFLKKTLINQYLSKAAVSLLLGLIYFNANGFTGGNRIKGKKAFDTITIIKPEEREYAAYTVYRAKFRHNTPAVAMRAPDHLFNLAGKLNDKSLQSCVFNLRAPTLVHAYRVFP